MNPGQQQQWRQMLRQSFSPRQWFDKEDNFVESTTTTVQEGRRIMWVYRRNYEPGKPPVWDVGFYSPTGEWHSDNEFLSKNEAAKRVNWLNGGGSA